MDKKYSRFRVKQTIPAVVYHYFYVVPFVVRYKNESTTISLFIMVRCQSTSNLSIKKIEIVGLRTNQRQERQRMEHMDYPIS